MIDLWTSPLEGGATARVGFTTRLDGDFAVALDPAALEVRRRELVDRPWVWLRQVHGGEVAVVADDHDQVTGGEADGLVTTRTDVVLSVNVADCAPVALVSRQGVVAAVHAGWRGVMAGVIERAAAVMRSLGAVDIEACLGPCIHPECYEFGVDDLELVRARLGGAIAGRTSGGAPALDLPMAVAGALGRAGVALVASADRCTACGGTDFYSHRARHDEGRHALVVRIDEPVVDG